MIGTLKDCLILLGDFKEASIKLHDLSIPNVLLNTSVPDKQSLGSPGQAD